MNLASVVFRESVEDPSRPGDWQRNVTNISVLSSNVEIRKDGDCVFVTARDTGIVRVTPWSNVVFAVPAAEQKRAAK
jgi:hypothetical protein